MRSDKKSPLKSDKKAASKIQKKGAVGYNKKSALLEDAISQMNAGKYGRASSALKELLSLDPLNAEARRLFATLHLRLGSLMSARTAFESLAREALDRQDYWLAESLLREYLIAGPRCVPFLEMLGHVYEEKGDAMAAVAEYGKAIEVLLEDADADRPNRASDLFAKIRELAPASPVAFRFAAMFDATTGHLLKQSPSPSEAIAASCEVAKEAVPASGPSSADAAPASNQAEPDANVPRSSTIGESTPAEPALQLASPSTVADMTANEESTPVVSSPSFDVPVEIASGEPAETEASQSPTPSVETPPSEPGVKEPPSAAPSLIPGEAIESSLPTTFTSESAETPEVVPTAADGMDGVPHSADTPAPLLCGRVEESLPEAPPPALGIRPSEDAQQEPASLSFEVVSQPSSSPISEAPSIPAPMPWDQVQDTPLTVPPAPDSKDDIHRALELAAESAAPIDVAPSPPAVPSDLESASTLSWDEILKTIDQFRTAPPVDVDILPVPGEQASIPVSPVEATFTALEPRQPVQEGETVADLPIDSPGTFAGEAPVDTAGLPAPMPWEQIEHETVTIPRQEREPEFGSMPVAVPPGADDPTLILHAPQAEDELTAEPATATASTADVVPTETELRILSLDHPIAPIPPPYKTIHIPEKAFQPEEEIVENVLALGDPELDGQISPEDQSIQQPVIATDVPIRQEFPEPPVVSHPGMETLQPSEVLQTDTDAHSPQLDPAAPTVDQKLTPEAMSAVPTAPPPESVAIPPQVSGIGNVQDETLSESPAVVGEIVELGALQGQAAPVMSCGLEEAPATIASEPASPTIAHGSVEDSAVQPAPLYEIASITLPESEPSCDVANACDNAELLSRAPGIDIDMERQPSPAATDTAQGLQVAETASAAAASAPVECSAPQESTAEPPAVPASPPPASDGGIRILWDDSSGKRIDASSSVGMLGRWLKRSGEEDSQAPAKQESAHEMAATPTDARREIAASAVDVLFDRPSAPRPTSVEEPVAQPKLRKPMGRRAASRVRMAATVLLTTCFSTTRSVVLSLVALVALAVACTAVVIGAAGLTWVVIEERANTSFQNMTSVPQRSLQDATKNGYFLLLGFNGPTNQDPLLTGFERKVDESDAEFARWCLGGEGNAAAMRQGASADVVTKWFQTVDPAKQIKAEAASVKSWTAQADVSMTRYRQWLKLPFEDWGYGEGASPNCSLILYAHRLYVAEGFAQDQDMGVERLEADLGAWRAVLGHAKSLPVKMLASTAMNDDVAVISGLLLRPDLDERLLGRLTKMARPLDQVEQSMRWPMQSQFIQATKALDQTLKQDKSESRSLYASLAAAMPLPKQRRFNDYAEYYEAAGKVASEGRYSNLPKRAQFVRSPAEGPADYFLNPIENIIGVEPLPAWETYGGRVLETDARLRLAGLQAWLRRTPPEQDLLTRIAKAGQSLYDPFTGLPMLVNLKRGLFYSVGQDLKDNDASAPGDVVAQIPLMAGQEIKRNSKAK